MGNGPQAHLLRQDVTLPVRLTSAAVQDLALAERWYLDEAPHVLTSFEREVDKAFRLISERPTLYQTVESTVRRALVQKFPFSSSTGSSPSGSKSSPSCTNRETRGHGGGESEGRSMSGADEVQVTWPAPPSLR